MEKTTMLTRAVLKAHDRIHSASRLAHDRYGHTPIMHERIDPRTAKRRQHAEAEMKQLVYQGGTNRIDVNPEKRIEQEPNVMATQRQIKFQKRIHVPLQSARNRAAGKPEMPSSFESGQAGDTASPSTVNASYDTSEGV